MVADLEIFSNSIMPQHGGNRNCMPSVPKITAACPKGVKIKHYQKRNEADILEECCPGCLSQPISSIQMLDQQRLYSAPRGILVQQNTATTTRSTVSPPKQVRFSDRNDVRVFESEKLDTEEFMPSPRKRRREPNSNGSSSGHDDHDAKKRRI